MCKKFSYIVLFLCFFTGYQKTSAQGYEIKFKIPALKDSTIIIGHHFAKENVLIPDDTIHLDKKGIGEMQGKKTLPGGIYIVLLPSKKYIDFLIDKEQHFSMEADTGDFLNTVKFNKSLENDLFVQYQKKVHSEGDIVHKLIERKKSSTNDAEKDSISKAIDQINIEMKGYINGIIKDHPDMLLAAFLKGMQEIDIPEPPKDSNGKILDSTFQYRYYRQHYFDNFDLTDTRLLHTMFYEQKVKNYLDKVVPQIPDTLNKEIDMLIHKVWGNDELFRNMLVSLFNNYANASNQIMGMDAVFVHIAETYYLPYATWSDKEYMDKLKKEIEKHKPNLIGKTAPDLNLIEVPTDHFVIAQSDTALKSNPYVGNQIHLLGIQAKFLVVAFWEADCGHCKKAIPILYDVYQRMQEKGVKVLAIHMISSVEGKRKWIDFVNEHNLYNWINAWSPYSHEYKDLYNVYSTPTIYVLDENKRIIAKQISAEQVEDFINFEINKQKAGDVAAHKQ